MSNNFRGDQYGQRIKRLITLLTMIHEKKYMPGTKEVLIEQFSKVLEMPNNEAADVFQLLQDDGILEVKHRITIEHPYWFINETEAGERYRELLKRSIMSRKKADQLLGEFLDRVQKVNSNDDFLYRVDFVKVYGSYLTDKDLIYGLSLYISLHCKIEGVEISNATIERFYDDLQKGRSFENYYAKFFAWRGEVIQFLDMQDKGVEFITKGEWSYMEEVESIEVFKYNSISQD